MATSNSTDHLEPKIMPSNTGNQFHPAKKAPLSSEQSQYIGTEQTSDGAKAEKRLIKIRARSNKGRATVFHAKGNRSF